MRYEWQELIPNRQRARWTHPGVAGLDDGTLAVTDPAGPAILFMTTSGAVTRRLPLAVAEVHAIAATPGLAGPSLLIADPGMDLWVRAGRVVNRQGQGKVVRLDPDGAVTLTIGAPPIRIHELHGAPFRPTAVAVASNGAGGSGDIWVADGYGTSFVHRFGADGSYRATITGEEGAGTFRNPHALIVASRGGEPELLVADRHNSRLQIFDLDGRYKRQVVDERLARPSALAIRGHQLIVAELDGGLVVLDEDYRHVETIFGRGPSLEAGWPNRLIADRIARPEVRPRAFRGAHAVATLPDLSLVVAEWILGGRVVRIVPREQHHAA